MLFIKWGRKGKAVQINNTNLGIECKNCNYKLFNIIYLLKRYDIYWIPVGDWKSKKIYIQCVNCKKTYELKTPEMINKAKELFLKQKKN